MIDSEAMRSALEKAHEMVLFYGKDGIISYANEVAETLLSYENGLVGRNVLEVYPGTFRDSNGFLELNRSLALDGFTMEAYRENRTCFPTRVRILHSKERQSILLAVDLSRSVELERRMEQASVEKQEASKIKSEFVANVTHELRTPVNGILGNTLELKDIETERAKLRVLSLIERGCADMNAIINNILDFSKLESGKFTLENREFNFREMMEYVKSNHKIKIADKGVDFVVSISEDIPQTIIGDELRIVQVLNNLISNACKFTAVGRISVEVVRTNLQDNRMELFFLVADTGIGISKEDQDKLFQSFSQVDASISRRYGGTGLGLNICKQLVELMGGSIHVESDAGKGSMFSFHVWVEVPEDELKKSGQTFGHVTTVMPDFAGGLGNVVSFEEFQKENGTDLVMTYGTIENLEEIKRKLNKLILSAEMESWEKAESFVGTLRELTEEAPKEIKNTALRLKMAVQKEDYEKTAQGVDTLRALLNQEA